MADHAEADARAVVRERALRALRADCTLSRRLSKANERSPPFGRYGRT